KPGVRVERVRQRAGDPGSLGKRPHKRAKALPDGHDDLRCAGTIPTGREMKSIDAAAHESAGSLALEAPPGTGQAARSEEEEVSRPDAPDQTAVVVVVRTFVEEEAVLVVVVGVGLPFPVLAHHAPPLEVLGERARIPFLQLVSR